MKKLILMLAVLTTVGFSQVNYSVGSFYGNLPISTMSNMVLLGQLPPKAILTGFTIAQSTQFTNYLSTTNHTVTVGLSTSTNYFLAATAVPAWGTITRPTAVSNAFNIINSNYSTPVYGRLLNITVNQGVQGSVRVIVNYIVR